MLTKIRKTIRRSSLAAKIRFFYILVMVPVSVLLVIAFYTLWSSTRQYQEMIRSIATASEFNLDFKKEYDYNTYLLIVESATAEELGLHDILGEANRIVSDLEGLQKGRNDDRLEGVRKYLSNLQSYGERIEENLRAGGRYEDNMEIWENDVQIVTTLIQESMFEYIFYEARALQESQAAQQRINNRFLGLALLAILLLVPAIVILSFYIPRSISRPIRELSEVTEQVAGGDLAVRAGTDEGVEVAALGESLNVMIDKIRELLDQVKNEQERLHQAEFRVLQAQINPHFLYNTLDAIVWLAEDGQQRQVVHMVRSLSEFFRTSLNQGRDIVTVREEVLHVRSYLEIQQVRYQDILTYEIDVPEELESYRIPKITIQPLVENALYHGIKNKRGQGKITVSGTRREDGFEIRVTDNGIGMREEQLEKIRRELKERPKEAEYFGLYNVNERIRLDFGAEYGISLESRWQEGTTVSVKLPCTTDSGRKK